VSVIPYSQYQYILEITFKSQQFIKKTDIISRQRIRPTPLCSSQISNSLHASTASTTMQKMAFTIGFYFFYLIIFLVY